MKRLSLVVIAWLVVGILGVQLVAGETRRPTAHPASMRTMRADDYDLEPEPYYEASGGCCNDSCTPHGCCLIPRVVAGVANGIGRVFDCLLPCCSCNRGGCCPPAYHHCPYGCFPRLSGRYGPEMMDSEGGYMPTEEIMAPMDSSQAPATGAPKPATDAPAKDARRDSWRSRMGGEPQPAHPYSRLKTYSARRLAQPTSALPERRASYSHTGAAIPPRELNSDGDARPLSGEAAPAGVAPASATTLSRRIPPNPLRGE